MIKRILVSLLALSIIGIIIFAFMQRPQPSESSVFVEEKIVSYPGDFSCQPNECESIIQSGINNVPYPSCNSLVQINNTGASNSKACDYWRTQQSYFGTENYVNLSELSKQQKQAEGESIIDGFLGLEDDIQIHRNAAPIFLKAEAKFNTLYGSNRQGSTYFLPSYPNGYTFEFSGSLNKRGVRGTTKTEDALDYEGQKIIPSNHFWGAAIDLDSSTNWGNRLEAGQCSLDIPPEIVTTFESVGLRWGGRYFADGDAKNLMDPMHFEYVPDCIDTRILNKGI